MPNHVQASHLRIQEANRLARQLAKPRPPGAMTHIQANRYMMLIAQEARDLIDWGATGLADKLLKRAADNMQNLANRGYF